MRQKRRRTFPFRNQSIWLGVFLHLGLKIDVFLARSEERAFLLHSGVQGHVPAVNARWHSNRRLRMSSDVVRVVVFTNYLLLRHKCTTSNSDRTKWHGQNGTDRMVRTKW